MRSSTEGAPGAPGGGDIWGSLAEPMSIFLLEALAQGDRSDCEPLLEPESACAPLLAL